MDVLVQDIFAWLNTNSGTITHIATMAGVIIFTGYIWQLFRHQ